jgi:Neuraminidase (sialidase)
MHVSNISTIQYTYIQMFSRFFLILFKYLIVKFQGNIWHYNSLVGNKSYGETYLSINTYEKIDIQPF